MGKEWDRELEDLHRAALEVTCAWSPDKRSMAVRAAGLDFAESKRASLDVIAANFGVSRETVRRARNELLAVLDLRSSGKTVYSLLSLPIPSVPPTYAPSTARALRRLLTMTGALRWDEVLSAWARAGGKAPHSPLPADFALMKAWSQEAGGFKVSGAGNMGKPFIIDVVVSEELDQVSQFLFETLRDQPGGVDRNVLLERAEEAGLKATTIANALSGHPAVMRVGRAMWALRGIRSSKPVESTRPTSRHRSARMRPTNFSWGTDGSLRIEFSVPRGPSPVVAVPKAVSEYVEGREFVVESAEKLTRVAVRNARLWGFGSLVSELGLSAGARVAFVLNLVAATAALVSAE